MVPKDGLSFVLRFYRSFVCLKKSYAPAFSPLFSNVPGQTGVVPLATEKNFGGHFFHLGIRV